jgi:hypothetical protein
MSGAVVDARTIVVKPDQLTWMVIQLFRAVRWLF